MTQEKLKEIESLTNEIKELNRTLTIFVATQYAENKHMGTDTIPSSTHIRGKMTEGIRIIDELKKGLY